MKKYFLSFIVSISIINFVYTQQAALPSVADVFGNMTEDEITRQVQMGQQFLADLEKYGTPEEKAEFEKILLETLNSMSEQDFQDIQNIAKMVEPHLQPNEPQPVTQPAPTITTKDEIAPVVTEDALEKFKNLIGAIINRIDDILQKIESSKECKEEFDVRWSNRTALSIMKRQIAQLKNNKLAEKLSKKDLAEDDKKLVDLLEAFLKDLSEKNSKLVIEDTFGLTDSKILEQKYLKQTQGIISMFDDFITSLTPMLEKFLNKWDPEALQLAKEAVQKSDKAQEDAKASLKRAPSPDARSSQPDRYNQRSSGYRDYDAYPDMYSSYGYSPDMYNQYYQDVGSMDNQRDGSSLGGGSSDGKSSNKSSAAPKDEPKAKDKLEIDQKSKENKSPKDKPDTFDDIVDAIESHFDQYTDDGATKNINFLNNSVVNDYKNLTPTLETKIQTWGKTNQGNDASGSKPNVEGVSEWMYQNFIPYTESVHKGLETDYQSLGNELDSAKRLFSKIEESAKELSAEEIKKVSDKLVRLENRFSSYHDVYNSAIKTIENSFENNFQKITARTIVGDEIQNNSDKPLQVKDVHRKFVGKLKSDIGDKISDVMAHINTLKSNMDRKVKRKSKSSKSSSLVMNVNA